MKQNKKNFRIEIILVIFSLITFVPMGLFAQQSKKSESNFLEGILKIIKFLPSLDEVIDQQIDEEKRRLLLKKVNRLSDDLLRLRLEKLLLTESLIDSTNDIERIRSNIRSLKETTWSLSSTLTEIAVELQKEEKLKEGQIRNLLKSGLDEKFKTLKDIEKRLLNTDNDNKSPDLAALGKEGKKAVELVTNALSQVSAIIRKLKKKA